MTEIIPISFDDNIFDIYENIVATDYLAMISNPNLDFLKTGRIVDLACGHKTLTKNKKKAKCPRCSEMLRRSITTGEEDHESFRKGLKKDTMSWIDDPMIHFHEAKNDFEFDLLFGNSEEGKSK